MNRDLLYDMILDLEVGVLERDYDWCIRIVQNLRVLLEEAQEEAELNFNED